jgi:hypothetical protein
MRVPLTLALILLSVGSAAQSIPKLDVPGFCAVAAGKRGGAGFEGLYWSCIDMAQEAYQDLQLRWSAIPEATRIHCLRAAAPAGSRGSYQTLKTCVDIQEEARTRNENGRSAE